MTQDPDYGTATLGVSTGEVYRVIGPDGSTMCECEDKSTAMQINTALMLLGPLQKTNKRLAQKAKLLIKRLNQWCEEHMHDEGWRDWTGHVRPAARRLFMLISELEEDNGEGE